MTQADDHAYAPREQVNEFTREMKACQSITCPKCRSKPRRPTPHVRSGSGCRQAACEVRVLCSAVARPSTANRLWSLQHSTSTRRGMRCSLSSGLPAKDDMAT